jgi:nucleoporin POM152
MSTGTPRLNSAFPETPVAAPPLRQRRGNSPARVGSVKQPLFAPKAPTTNPKPTDSSPSIVQTSDPPPLIPEDVIDAPTQRLYAVAVFVLLQAWKFYDIARLYAADGDSISELWFCVKWLVLDGCFFGFLPILRIPWINFNTMFTLCAIATFSVMDIFISLKYQLPITAFFGAFWKRMYDPW